MGWFVDLLKDLDGFTGPLLLLLAGAVVRQMQTRIQDRRQTKILAERKAEQDRIAAERKDAADRLEAERLRAERERKEQALRQEAKELAEKAEQAAIKERERLESDLRREREDRQRELSKERELTVSQIHDLKSKMQAYENLKGIHEQQVSILEREKKILEDRLGEYKIQNEKLKWRLKRHEPIHDDDEDTHL